MNIVIYYKKLIIKYDIPGAKIWAAALEKNDACKLKIGDLMPLLERVFLSLVLGAIGLGIGFLLGMAGVTLLAGYPTPYVLGISFALVGLLFGTSAFNWFDIFDWFSS